MPPPTPLHDTCTCFLPGQVCVSARARLPVSRVYSLLIYHPVCPPSHHPFSSFAPFFLFFLHASSLSRHLSYFSSGIVHSTLLLPPTPPLLPLLLLLILLLFLFLLLFFLFLFFFLLFSSLLSFSFFFFRFSRFCDVRLSFFRFFFFILSQQLRNAFGPVSRELRFLSSQL